ncbi:MAG: AEC family transporter [Magnetospirillum sp.]
MELISNLAAVVAPVFLMSAMGYFWKRLGYAFDQALVTNLVTLVGAPCLVFSTFTKTPLPVAELGTMAVATIACLGIFAVVAGVGLRVAGQPLRIYLPSLVFPNIGNLGLPVCLFAFGDRGLTLAMIFFAVTTIGQFTLGPALAAGEFNLRRLLKIPFIYAVIVSMALGIWGVSIPQWIANTASLAGGLTVPLMLMALGVALAQLRATSLPRAVTMSVIRIIMGAAGGWAVAALLDLDPVQRGVVILESAMPVAVFNYLFAVMYNNAPEEVAGMVLVSTVISYLTLPILVMVLV